MGSGKLKPGELKIRAFRVGVVSFPQGAAS